LTFLQIRWHTQLGHVLHHAGLLRNILQSRMKDKLISGKKILHGDKTRNGQKGG